MIMMSESPVLNVEVFTILPNQVVLDRVEMNGGKIIVPKMQHADESGYFAIFLDTEGNRMALNSLR